MNIGERILITGGLGFIGSYFVEQLSQSKEVIILDNFLANSKDAYDLFKNKKNITIFNADILDCDFSKFLEEVTTVFHFAANSDISNGVNNPQIDFDITTRGTYRLLQAMSENNVKNIVYPSGSGVYGNLKEISLYEDFGPLEPVSFYGASKLSAEAFISSFCHMKGLEAKVFRFANVVGQRQTHGVAYDFVRRLKAHSSLLEVKGNGYQSKSYIHVEDVYSGIMQAIETQSNSIYEVFNLATQDYLTVREIVSQTLDILDLSALTRVAYETSESGWPGDVPIVRFDTKRIRALGWKNKYSSLEATRKALEFLKDHDFS